MELCMCRGGACGFLITGLKRSLHCETRQAIVKTIQCKRTSLSSCSHIESGSLCGGLGDHWGPVRKRTYRKGDGEATATLKAGASANDGDTLSPFVGSGCSRTSWRESRSTTRRRRRRTWSCWTNPNSQCLNFRSKATRRHNVQRLAAVIYKSVFFSVLWNERASSQAVHCVRVSFQAEREIKEIPMWFYPLVWAPGSCTSCLRSRTLPAELTASSSGRPSSTGCCPFNASSAPSPLSAG